MTHRDDLLNERGAAYRAVSGVHELFAHRHDELRAPSSSWGVFDGEGLVASGVTGEIAGTAPSRDAVYRIASCTKSFTATALLALRDAGTIILDDPITDYVPAFADVELPTEDSPVPTLRMLMTMSAGLPTDDPWGDRQESISDDDLDALLGHGLRFDSIPGTRFAYSNLGYALLGRAISVASGRSYREVVTDDILRPLGLASTSFVRPEGIDDRLAVGHRRIDDRWEPLPFSGPGGFSSIGGLFSTVPDLAHWAGWLASAFDGDETGAREGETAGILSRSSRREMQQAYRTIPSASATATGYGFGLVVEEVQGLGTVVSHSGGYPGFSAHMRWHTASGWGIVAFENATYAQVSVPATTALHGLIADLDLTRPPTIWPEVAVARMAVERAVMTGDDVPLELLSENVELDLPFATRRAAWADALASIGGLTSTQVAGDADPAPGGPQAVDADAGQESTAPSHLVWRLPGEHGRLRLEIRMTPEGLPRLQTITVGAERLG